MALAETRGQPEFPDTSWSAIQGLASADPETRRRLLDGLAEKYWRCVFYVIRARRRCDHETAKDLTQDFFREAIERCLLERADPARGSFRNYLRGAIRFFLIDEQRRASHRRTYRFEGKVDDEMPDASDPEATLDQTWVDDVLQGAADDLKQQLLKEGRTRRWAVYERLELNPEPPAYQQVATELSCTVDEVDNELKRARATVRGFILARVRESVSTNAQFEEELRRVFGK